jgi:hypothetical protein
MAADVSTSAREIHRRLGHLRRRLRALFAVLGVTRWVAALAGALLLFFLADWLLDLPLGVRRFVRLGLLDRPEGLGEVPWILLFGLAAVLAWQATRRRRGAAPFLAFAAGGLAGVLVWLGARLLRPLSVSLTDQDLALSVEQRFRQVNDRLAAALDFERELSAPSRGESPAMMEAVVREAAEETKHIEFAHAVSTRRAFAWTGIAGVSAGVLLLLGALWPTTVGLWIRRSLSLEDVAWPRSTTLVLVARDAGGWRVHDPAVALEVAVGRPLTVLARAEGRVPSEVLLLDHGEGRPLPRRMFPVPDQDDVFQLEIRDVRRPFSFVLHGGDDADDVPRYRVEITVPPRVLSISTGLAFPAYLARPDERREGGSVTVPEGTRVEVAFEADADVAEATVLRLDEVLTATAVEGSPRRFTVAFVATESGPYRIRLRTPEGRENDPAEDSYDVRVDADRPPEVALVHPRGPTSTTPAGRLAILGVAEDDHGVADLALEVRRGEGEPTRHGLLPYVAEGDAGPWAATDGPYGRREVRCYVPLDVATLRDEAGAPPAPPARLAVRLVVTDSKGQVRPGPWASLDVYRDVEIERTLASRRTGIRAAVVAAQVDQRASRDRVHGLSEGPIGDSERDALKSVQFAQAKIAQDVDQAVRDLLDVFNAFVYDRLGAENPNEKILAILDRHHRATYGRAPEAAAGAPAARAEDPVFPYALYDELVAAWKDRAIFDTGVLDRMLAVLAEAVDAAARRAPAAHEALVRAAEEPVPERLAAALAAQDALLASLERVLETMRSWQSLNDMILLVRRLVEEQEALNERLDSGEPHDPPPSPPR